MSEKATTTTASTTTSPVQPANNKRIENWFKITGASGTGTQQTRDWPCDANCERSISIRIFFFFIRLFFYCSLYGGALCRWVFYSLLFKFFSCFVRILIHSHTLLVKRAFLLHLHSFSAVNIKVRTNNFNQFLFYYILNLIGQ